MEPSEDARKAWIDVDGSGPVHVIYIVFVRFYVLWKLMHDYSPLHQIETIMEMGYPIECGDWVEEDFMKSSDTQDEYFLFMTYRVFNKLESLLTKKLLY